MSTDEQDEVHYASHDDYQLGQNQILSKKKICVYFGPCNMQATHSLPPPLTHTLTACLPACGLPHIGRVYLPRLHVLRYSATISPPHSHCTVLDQTCLACRVHIGYAYLYRQPLQSQNETKKKGGKMRKKG